MVQKSALKQKILIICGPTAVGKTDFAIQCAKKLNGEIIGADSVQIYRGLDIGSGKVTLEEMQGIPHHLIDILHPQQEFSVSEYVLRAKAAIKEISLRGKLPIIAGGTGLYINSLLNGHNFADSPKDDVVRERLKALLFEKGKDYLHEMLCKIDPISAEKISVNDTKRVIRALEIYEVSGKPKSQAVKETKDCPFDYKMVVLDKDRKLLYDAINNRVDKMIANGLLDEVASLIEFKDCQSMQAIGYKEMVGYLENAYDFNATTELIKTNSRHYAKRQLTFFKGMKCDKLWINTSDCHIMSDIIW